MLNVTWGVRRLGYESSLGKVMAAMMGRRWSSVLMFHIVSFKLISFERR